MTGVYILRLIPSTGVPTYFVLVEQKDKTASVYATTTFLHVAVAKAKSISGMAGKVHTTDPKDLELWKRMDEPERPATGGMFTPINKAANG